MAEAVEKEYEEWSNATKLPEVAESVEEEGVTPDFTPFTRAIEAVNEKITTTSQNASLLADPLVRAVLDAKAKGKTPRIVTDDEPALATETPQPNLETMSNSELVTFLTKSISASQEKSIAREVEERVGKRLAEIEPTLTELANAHQSNLSKGVAGQIQEAKDKYGDFTAMQPVMVELNKSVQGLSVDDLYWLAKRRSGVPQVSQTKLSSERPSTPPRERGSSLPTRAIRGRAGFQTILEQQLGA